MTVTETETGVTAIFEGAARQKWRRTGLGKWQLDGVWPSNREKIWALQALYSGRSILVIQNSVGESVDLLEEEASDPDQLTRYVTARAGGVISLFIPSLDWLPSRITKAASSFIAECIKLDAITGSQSTVLTPPLGCCKNLRVIYAPAFDSAVQTTEHLNELAKLAFPQLRTRKKRT